MKVAIIDMGSNSIRLLLGEFVEGTWQGQPKRLWTTRLGQRNEDGSLSQASMEASYKALKDIQEAVRNFGADCVYGLATSAVREAPNGTDFMAEAAKICPMEGHIISGDKEAELGFLGATSDYLSSGNNYAILDVGGGSSEIAIGCGQGLLWSHSYPMGAVRFQALSDASPSAVSDKAQSLWLDLPDNLLVEEWIGIGGTATTLGAMDLAMEVYDPERLQGHRVNLERIEAMVADLRSKTAEEKRMIPGLQPGRADIITAGAEIVVAAMHRYGAKSLIISEKDGMEGFVGTIHE